MSSSGKYTKDYCPPKGSSAPQGKSSEEFVADKVNYFVDYLAEKARPALIKDEVSNYKKRKGGLIKADAGLPVTGDIGGTAEYDPDMFWMYNQGANASTITPPAAPDFGSGLDSEMLKGTPQGTPIQTNGYSGNFGDVEKGPYGAYSKSKDEVPQYVKDFKKNPPSANTSASKGAGAAEAAGKVGGMGNMISSLPGMIDPGMVIDSFAQNYRDKEERRKKQWLERQMAIENVIPKSYGSRGDYDLNSGAFRPDQIRSTNYKAGGEKVYNQKNSQNDIEFQNWYSKNTLEGQKGIPYKEDLTYDYYSFYKNKGQGDIKNHFPDTYKRPSHPTFSNESIYSTPDNIGGRWDGENYIKKKGGEKQLPKAFWGALISLIPAVMGMMKKNGEEKQQQQQMLLTQQQQQAEAETQARMNVLAGAQNFSQQLPTYKMGGTKKCYKKGGSYQVDEKELVELVKLGYDIEFED